MWEKDYNKYKIPVRLMQKYRENFKDFDSQKDGHWGTRDMFCIKRIYEVVSVEPKLDNVCVW